MMLRIHGFVSHSLANGPGTRTVIWVQGCRLRCPGCFNQDTHDLNAGQDIDPLRLAAAINSHPVRGVTLSGGEPLLQPEPLTMLLGALSPDKDILLYSGLSVAEAVKSPARRAVLLKCDAALMGRYRDGDRHPYDNKELVIRTACIKAEELRPHRAVEVIVGAGRALVTGFPGTERIDTNVPFSRDPGPRLPYHEQRAGAKAPSEFSFRSTH